MAKAIVIYYSETGNTKTMAEIIAQSIRQEGVECKLKNVRNIKDAKILLDYDAIVIGSPTYYGTMAAEIKELLDKSVAFHSKLDAKVGAAFSSSGNIAGGNETTVLSILNALLIHGMIIQGDPAGDHYGPVSIGKVNSRVETNCRRFGKRVADLTKKIALK